MGTWHLKRQLRWARIPLYPQPATWWMRFTSLTRWAWVRLSVSTVWLPISPRRFCGWAIGWRFKAWGRGGSGSGRGQGTDPGGSPDRPGAGDGDRERACSPDFETLLERVSASLTAGWHSIRIEGRGEWLTPFDVPSFLRAGAGRTRPGDSGGGKKSYAVDPAISSLPILVLDVHNRCNCRCVMCDIWKRDTAREMDPDDLTRHLPAIEKLGVQWVVLTGGEPLMHSRLFSLCAPLRKLGIRITLLTTGLLLSRFAEDVAREIDDVIVSLDGPPRLMTGSGAFRMRSSISATVFVISAVSIPNLRFRLEVRCNGRMPCI